MKSKLEELIEFYGSQTALSRVLNVSRVAVSQWCDTGAMPPLRAVQIEILTDGAFKAVDLCEGGPNEQ